ncbi:hypothetical protein GOBAR_AA04407 [Gossypium barbadense]|uniref:SWIM-type domain-containing protein n=1 Tax=Gossypium barbadense TaxID=3634 RepID=A0A2P5YKU6_GOSBA|nr:hypothetical protein GOBAR_AA04407 [Gossypium barbadense]
MKKMWVRNKEHRMHLKGRSQTLIQSDRYIPGSITDLETLPMYFDDRLVFEKRTGELEPYLLLSVTVAFKISPITSTAYDISDPTTIQNDLQKVREGFTVRAHDVKLSRVGQFCTNRDTYLPITSVVKETYFRLATLFTKRVAVYAGQIAGGHALSEDDRSEASYRVDLTRGTCDCGRFQAFWFLCAHVIAACGNLRIEYMPYINDVYSLECMHRVWNLEFLLVLDKSTWLPVSSALLNLSPNMNLRHVSRGCPNTTWIRNNIDIQERDDQQRLCEYCRNLRHTKATCSMLRVILGP